MNQNQTGRSETSAKGAGNENTSAAGRSSGMSDRSREAQAEAPGLVDGWNFRLIV